MMGTVWRYLVAIKGSIFGFLAALGLAFLTLGYSSLALYAVFKRRGYRNSVGVNSRPSILA